MHLTSSHWPPIAISCQFSPMNDTCAYIGILKYTRTPYLTNLDRIVSHKNTLYVAWTPYNITLQNEFHKSLVQIIFLSPASSPCASQWPPASMNNFSNNDMSEISLIHAWCLLISASWCSISSPWLFFRLSSCFCCCCLKYWSSWAFSFLPNAPPASRTAPKGDNVTGWSFGGLQHTLDQGQYNCYTSPE